MQPEINSNLLGLIFLRSAFAKWELVTQKLELAICVPLTKMESNFDQNGLKLTTKTVFVTTISELFPDLLYYI